MANYAWIGAKRQEVGGLSLSNVRYDAQFLGGGKCEVLGPGGEFVGALVYLNGYLRTLLNTEYGALRLRKNTSSLIVSFQRALARLGIYYQRTD